MRDIGVKYDIVIIGTGYTGEVCTGCEGYTGVAEVIQGACKVYRGCAAEMEKHRSEIVSRTGMARAHTAYII